MISKAFIAPLILAAAAQSALAYAPVSVPAPADVSMTRQGNLMQVSMQIPLQSLSPDANRTISLTPVIVNGND